MNIQEVEKHVKFDLIFTLLIFIGVGLCFLLSIVFIFKPTSVKAQTQIADLNSSIYTHCGNGTSYNKYCDYNPYVVQVETARSLNTTYNGVTYTISFGFQRNMSAFSQYILNIYAMSTDFRDNDMYVNVYGSNSEGNIGTMMLNTSYSMISKNQIQVIIPQNSYSYHYVDIVGEPLTGVNNFGIKKITLTWDDGTTDVSGVIENQTQNTQDIINSGNSNTQEIINNNNINFTNLLSQFATICPNLFDNSNVIPNFNIISDGSYSYDTNASLTVVDVIPGQSYTLKSSVNRQWVYNFANTLNFGDTVGTARVVSGGNMISFVVPDGYNRFILRSYPSNNENNATQQVMMLKGRNLPATAFGTYCVHGSVSANKLDAVNVAINGATAAIGDTNDKLDDLNDTQQATYDYLTDNSDPSINTSDMNNVIGQVNIQDPLNYLLTLPINLLTKLNSVISAGTCSRASFGELYGTELYLPCINFENYLGSSLWGTIDTIVGIGLLAIILKKFYDSISNILSLGKEEEVRKGMELPTPMEFLAQILGGGK